MKMKSVSVVIPVYNSANILPGLLLRLEDVLKAHFKSFEIILVNDASPDDAWNVIVSEQKKRKSVIGICLAKNAGQYRATLCGVSAARYPLVITMDDDGQHLPEDIPRLCDAFEAGDFDVLCGVNEKGDYSPIKYLGSACLEVLLRVILKKPKKVNVTSFRIMGPVAIQALKEDRSLSSLIPAIILSATRRIGNAPVQQGKRISGSSGYSFTALFNLAFDLIFYNSIAPLRVTVFMSFLAMGLCLFAGVFVFVRSSIVEPDATMVGWSSLWVLISFSTGAIIAVLGVISEYLGRLVQESLGRRQYWIREKVGGE